MAIVEGAHHDAGIGLVWDLLPGVSLHLASCWGTVACFYMLDPPRTPSRTVSIEAREQLAKERRRTLLAWTVGSD